MGKVGLKISMIASTAGIPVLFKNKLERLTKAPQTTMKSIPTTWYYSSLTLYSTLSVSAFKKGWMHHIVEAMPGLRSASLEVTNVNWIAIIIIPCKMAPAINHKIEGVGAASGSCF